MASQSATESVQGEWRIRLLRPALKPLRREIRQRRAMTAVVLTVVGLGTLCALGLVVSVLCSTYRSKPQFLTTAADAGPEELVLMD
jgi:hypothetical protein